MSKHESFDAGKLNLVKRCRYGTMLYNRHDAHIGRSLHEYGEWAEDEMNVLRTLVEPGMVVLDIGANIGTHTLFFSQQVGPDGMVIAAEPQRIVFQMLNANIALNSILNVVTVHAGFLDVSGSAKLENVDYGKPQNFGAVRLGDAGQTSTVPITTLDALGLSRCGLIKIDVEGVELRVLKGGEKTIQACRPSLFVENNTRDERSVELITHLQNIGYRLFWHVSGFYNPNNFFGNSVNVFGRICDSNMVCVPQERADNFTGLPVVEGPHDTAMKMLERMRKARN